MQNKGLINFFAIIFALVSIYQLSFTFVSSKIKDDAKASLTEIQKRYLDSISKEKCLT
jgi:SecD/SecF fusion protein